MSRDDEQGLLKAIGPNDAIQSLNTCRQIQSPFIRSSIKEKH